MRRSTTRRPARRHGRAASQGLSDGNDLAIAALVAAAIAPPSARVSSWTSRTVDSLTTLPVGLRGTSMRYFVTGATGFIGRRLTHQLRQAGHEVVALVRQPARAGDLAALGVELAPGDVTERASLPGPMRGVDGLFHLAGWYRIGVRDGRPGQAINVEGTRNVLETARDLGVPKIVYTSTLAVFGDTHGRIVDETYRAGGPWLSAYDRTKWRAHYEVAEPMVAAGLPLVIVQPGGVYGPDDPSALGQMLRAYLRRELRAVPRRTAVSWGHVDDIARGHILAMERGCPGESYIIAGPAHTLIEALTLAERLTGIPAPRLHVPPRLVRALAETMAAIERVTAVPADYSAEYLRVAAGATYLGNSNKARRELGFQVRSLAEGLGETLAAEMARLGIAR